MGQPLILDEAVLARQPDCLFVEALGIERAAFEARDFRAYQCSAVGESCRTILRPERDLPMMSRQRFQMPGPLLGRGRIATRSASKCPVEMVFSQLELSRRRPKQGRGL